MFLLLDDRTLERESFWQANNSNNERKIKIDQLVRKKLNEYYPTNYHGEHFNDPEKKISQLKINDIIRVIIRNQNYYYEQHYVKILKIDRYKKGKLHKSRKFKGEVLEIFDCSYKIIPIGSIVTFRKENISEIPDWSEYSSEQHNLKKVEIMKKGLDKK